MGTIADHMSRYQAHSGNSAFRRVAWGPGQHAETIRIAGILARSGRTSPPVTWPVRERMWYEAQATKCWSLVGCRLSP